jgi:hypothetical protein
MNPTSSTFGGLRGARKIILLSAFFSCTLLASTAHAQATINTCRQRIVREFTAVRDEYRAHVFGSRRDILGNFTVVSGGAALSEITGILETKKRLASELIQPLVKSYRTLSCKMLAVCKAVSDSISTSSSPLAIDVLGCESVTLPRFGECSLTSAVGTEQSSLQDAAAIQSECEALLKDTLTAERSALKLAVAYDAGYRSLLQFSGIMDWMQEKLSSTALRPIRDMINLLGKLHQIPCFIGQCDNPTPPSGR